MSHQKYYEKYYEILTHSLSIEKRLKQIDSLGEEYDLYKNLLTYLVDINSISIDEINNKIQLSTDDSITILYKEIKFYKIFVQLRKKYPKAFNLLNIGSAKRRWKWANEALSDNQFLSLLDFGKELYSSPYHPFLVCTALSRIFDKINQTEKSLMLIENLYLWYPDEGRLKSHIYHLHLQCFLRNRKRKQIKKIWPQINNPGDQMLYRFIKFPTLELDLSIFFYSLGFLIFNIFVGKITLIAFSPVLFLNIFLTYLSIRKRNSFLLSAYYIKLLLICYSYFSSIIIFLIIRFINTL